jgi:gliding motility-associated-like protein
VTAGGGTLAYTYLWSPVGATGVTANNIGAGAYTVTVTDAHGCTQTATAAIAEPPLLIANTPLPTNVTCFGLNNGSASVTVGGGTTPYIYAWTPVGGTGATASNLAANSYTVLVTDEHGCTQTATVTITQPPVLTANPSLSNVICFGQNNGWASVIAAGGTGTYTYAWSPVGGNGAAANNLVAGAYTVLVTDGNGCMQTATVTITQPPLLIDNTSPPTNVSCNGLSDGSAVVTVAGGMNPYTYSWLPSGGIGTTASNLIAGTYTIVVSDANGCLTASNVVITEPPLLTSALGSTDVICFGGNTGTAVVNANGGTGAYTYAWNTTPVQTTQNAGNLTAGPYSVVVTDAHGCTTSSNVVITEPALLTAVMPTPTDNICFNGIAGSASVVVNGGIAPYTYNWTPAGGNSDVANNLPAGTYTVDIADANGCLTMQSVVITQPPPLTLAVNTPSIICIGQSTTITATAGGGTAPYAYLWDNLITDSTQVVSPAVTTSYIVNVTDANGCTVPAQTITANVYPPLNVAASGPPSVCANQLANLSSAGAGGNGGPYTYSWSNGANTSNISLTITQDTTLMVTFSDGCSPAVQTAVNVIANPNPVVNFSPWIISGCTPLTVDFVDSSVTTPNSSYLWSLGDGTSSNVPNFTYTYTNPGTYNVSLTVTTAQNCVSSLALQNVITVYALPTANFTQSSEELSILDPNIKFSNISSGADVWGWDFGDNDTSTVWSPAHQYTDTGVYTIKLDVITIHGCRDVVYGEVKVIPEFTLFIPNNFTPNNDGINDGFRAWGIGVADFDMWIIDRWGAKIYHSTDINVPWDGTYFNDGKTCQSDVYVYKIRAHDFFGKEHVYIGHVTLWR